MIVGADFLFGVHDGLLLGRVAVGVDGVNADDPADGLADVGAVASDQDHAGGAGLAHGPHHPGRVRPQRPSRIRP
jgi:hypothetical protein